MTLYSYLWTVDIEPPVADKVLLVEEGAVGAQVAVGDQAGVTIFQSRKH